MPLDPLAARLRRLLTEGALPASALSPGARRHLQPLFDAGVLSEQRAGAGRRVVVARLSALEAFITRHYPSGLQDDPSGELPRSDAVARFRDAKRGAPADAEPVFLRGFGDAALLGPGGESLPVADWTRRAGVAALRVGADCPWGWAGTLAVVENLEVFLHWERLETAAPLALYAAGRLSGRVLGWFASQAMARCRFLHCGDYDPVGLDEYLRLAAACPGRVTLLLPANLEALFARYGKPDLLASSPEILARLRTSQDHAVVQVVALMDRFGCGLEQEILLRGTQRPTAWESVGPGPPPPFPR